MSEDNQEIMFPEHEPDKWENHWLEMPDFKQEDLTSFRKIVVHFRCAEDVEEFAKLINQKVTPKQPSLWFPFMAHRKASHLRYVQE